MLVLIFFETSCVNFLRINVGDLFESRIGQFIIIVKNFMIVIE